MGSLSRIDVRLGIMVLFDSDCGGDSGDDDCDDDDDDTLRTREADPSEGASPATFIHTLLNGTE
jgi:hypothetical protein